MEVGFNGVWVLEQCVHLAGAVGFVMSLCQCHSVCAFTGLLAGWSSILPEHVCIIAERPRIDVCAQAEGHRAAQAGQHAHGHQGAQHDQGHHCGVMALQCRQAGPGSMPQPSLERCALSLCQQPHPCAFA